MGGSQGASKVNELALAAVPACGKPPLICNSSPDRPRDLEKVRAGYQAHHVPALVSLFVTRWHCAGRGGLARQQGRRFLSGGTGGAARAAVLIPYPAAADNHQPFNALALRQKRRGAPAPTGAATPALLAALKFLGLLDASKRSAMRRRWPPGHRPERRRQIAENPALEDGPKPTSPLSATQAMARLELLDA